MSELRERSEDKKEEGILKIEDQSKKRKIL
jgi:hypothetical protein